MLIKLYSLKLCLQSTYMIFHKTIRSKKLFLFIFKTLIIDKMRINLYYTTTNYIQTNVTFPGVLHITSLFYATINDNLQSNFYYIELTTFFQTYFTYEGYGRHPEHAIHPNSKYMVTLQSLPMYIGEKNQVNSVITADVTSPGWLLSWLTHG